jgi:hypothetical protein
MSKLEQTLVSNDITLKTITELLGRNFYIPDYQRGYRWTTQNVIQLLEDIWEYRQEKSNADKFYCLQPIVVRRKSWTDQHGQPIEGYELIDGQQRLTTLHRILYYLHTEHLRVKNLSELYGMDSYTIDYKTRPKTKSFLNQQAYDYSKPDLHYLSKAYETIKAWFENHDNIGPSGKNKFMDVLLPDAQEVKPEWSVQVIWYEIKDTTQQSEQLFTRLNRGKIPLTSAELIKAKFVNKSSFSDIKEEDRIKRRTQLIQLWDEMENHLNQPQFWAFIANVPKETYSSKIEYLFDISTQKKTNERDPLYSFLHFFDRKETAATLWEKWIKVEQIYRSLRYWYQEKDLYHKIGYLITVGESIHKLVDISAQQPKDQFQAAIDDLIATYIPDNWQDLEYSNRQEYQKITRVLLLVNIELTRTNHNNNDFFPFEGYKKLDKSLEHIHAQNIEAIDVNKQEQWKQWLEAHKALLKDLATDQKQAKKLTVKVDQAIDSTKLKYAEFERLSEQILALLPATDEENEQEYLHSIQNLALLGREENSLLNNSIFEVKRRKVVELDKKGAFVPIATRRVFLNYYAQSSQQQPYRWTAAERNAYLKELTHSLQPYLNLKNTNDEDEL